MLLIFDGTNNDFLKKATDINALSIFTENKIRHLHCSKRRYVGGIHPRNVYWNAANSR